MPIYFNSFIISRTKFPYVLTIYFNSFIYFETKFLYVQPTYLNSFIISLQQLWTDRAN